MVHCVPRLNIGMADPRTIAEGTVRQTEEKDWGLVYVGCESLLYEVRENSLLGAFFLHLL